jgi:hypothetical protein
VAIFLGLFLLVRGVPALLVYARALGWRQRAALGVLQSTALPLLVVITQIGLDTHHMLPVNATALVGAGMVSVLVFPLAGFALAGRGTDVDVTPVGERVDSDPAIDPL